MVSIPDAVRDTFELPETVEPLTALAIGVAGDAGEDQQEFVARDQRERTRKTADEFILYGGP